MQSVTRPEIIVRNPDEPLSDQAVAALAVLLLAAVDNDENDGRTGTTGVSRES